MTKTEIMPGPCGFIAKVTADKTGESEMLSLAVESDCKAIKKLAESLGDTVDPMKVCFTRGESPLGDAAKAACRVHTECPVVTGIFRTIAAEAGFALKKDVYIKFEE